GVVAFAQSGLPLVDETGEGVGAASVKAVVFRFGLPAFAPVLHSLDVSFSLFSCHDFLRLRWVDFFGSRWAIRRSHEVVLKAIFRVSCSFVMGAARRGAKCDPNPSKLVT
ncbi:MAG: hypothetical protein ACI9NQ_001070, partial [Paracoccaceae bacterium]